MFITVRDKKYAVERLSLLAEVLNTYPEEVKAILVDPENAKRLFPTLKRLMDFLNIEPDNTAFMLEHKHYASLLLLKPANLNGPDSDPRPDQLIALAGLNPALLCPLTTRYSQRIKDIFLGAPQRLIEFTLLAPEQGRLIYQLAQRVFDRAFSPPEIVWLRKAISESADSVEALPAQLTGKAFTYFRTIPLAEKRYLSPTASPGGSSSEASSENGDEDEVEVSSRENSANCGTVKEAETSKRGGMWCF